MSQTLDQIYIANPSTTMAAADLLYLVHSPYTSGTDSAITYANFASTVLSGAVLLNPAGAQTITGFGLTVPSLTTANMSFDVTANTIKSTGTNAGIFVSPNGTGATVIGSTTAESSTGAQLQFITVANQTTYGMYAYSNGSAGNSNIFNSYKSRSNAVNSFSALSTNDVLGAFQWYGDDGAAFQKCASITAKVSGSVSAGIVPGALTLFTTNTSGASTLAMTISNAQIVTLANALLPASGGTGVNNGSNTLTLAGTLATSGAFASVFTMTGATNVTFPTSGTLATTASASGIVNSGLINQLTWYAANGTTVSGLATANNGLLVTSAGGVPSIGNAIGADITIQGVTSGRGPGAIATNTTFGAAAGYAVTAGGIHLSSFGYQANGSIVTATDSSAFGYNSLVVATGGFNSAFGSGAGTTVTTGINNTLIGFDSGQSNVSGQANMTTGSTNTLLGFQTGVNNLATTGSIAIGANAQSDIATGSTSGTNGPGIAIGSATFPVGFRGDGTIYPSTTGAGFWRPKLNGTYYNIPLLTDGATAWPAITTSSVAFTTTSGIIGTTTNDSAAAGSVGEYINSSVGPSSVSSGSAQDITSISLSAGDWNVWGAVDFNGGATTNVTLLWGWVSSSSAATPPPRLSTSQSYGASGIVPFAINDVSFPVPMLRFSLASTATIYLTCYPEFSVSTMTAAGAIYARRVR